VFGLTKAIRQTSIHVLGSSDFPTELPPFFDNNVPGRENAILFLYNPLKIP
jgi:hypothetical protein